MNGSLIASTTCLTAIPARKFDNKLAWFEWLIAHAPELKAAGLLVAMASDYNVVPTRRISGLDIMNRTTSAGISDSSIFPPSATPARPLST